MFKKIKQQIQYLYDTLNSQQAGILEMQKDLKEHIKTRIDAVPCEVCGCMLDSKYAIKGAPVIEEPKFQNIYGYELQYGERHIRDTHYCKIHAPKEKKVIKKTAKPVKKSNKK